MHISEKEKIDFQSGRMSTEETIAFLEHLDECDFCLDQLMQEEELYPAVTPLYLKDQILKTALSPEVQITKAVRTTSKRMQHFYDGLRTAFGVVMALFLLFAVDLADLPQSRNFQSVQAEVQERAAQSRQKGKRLYDLSCKIGEGLSDGTERVTEYLNDFSSKITWNGGN